jgi:hypothetical protein
MAPNRSIFDALPSGKLTLCDIENGPFVIVDLPKLTTLSGDFPVCYATLYQRFNLTRI